MMFHHTIGGGKKFGKVACTQFNLETKHLLIPNKLVEID